MSFKIGKTRVNKTMVYLVIGILAFAFILTNANSLHQQAQYTIFNEITATSYVYSDDGNINVGANQANEQIQVKVVLDDLSVVTSVSASIYDSNNNHMGITSNLLIASADSYESGWIDVSALPNGGYIVICQVLAGGIEVNQPSNYDLWIQHPAQDMSYTFSVYKNDIVITETEIVAGVLEIKVDIITGVATGGYMHIYRGTKDVMYGDKIDSIVGLDAVLAGYTFDGDNLESGDYWVSLSILGNTEWLGFTESIAINLQNTLLDPITSDVRVYNFENDAWNEAESPGILHDNIRITAKVLTGTPIGYSMDIQDAEGILVGTYSFVYDAADDIWKLEFDTKSIANGDYTFTINAIKFDGVTFIPQSAWSLGIWTPDDPAEGTNILIWVAAIGAIGIVVLMIYMKKKNSGY